jgi:hypothetical protein
MGTENVVPLTAKERSEQLNGPCVAVVCVERCEFFAYNYNQDSFRICECGHTQHAHSKGEQP